MTFLNSLPLTPPTHNPASQVTRSTSFASTLFLSSSESSGTEEFGWLSQLKGPVKSTAGLRDRLDPRTPATPASDQDPISPSPPQPVLPSPAPLIPLFPGVTTPTSAPHFALSVRPRERNRAATFFDVFAPEVDTPSPIRLTRLLSFPSLPAQPVTSMSTTWNMPQVVLEEDENERQTPQIRHARRLSDVGPMPAPALAGVSALGRPLGSPISLFRSRNESDVSIDAPSLVCVLPESSSRLSTVSCHTFGHSVEHSASLQVLYTRSPSPAVSGHVTPVAGGSSVCDGARPERDDAVAAAAVAAASHLLRPISPNMLRPPGDSPASAVEKPRRRRGSGAAKGTAASRSIYVHAPNAPPVPAIPRPYPSIEDIRRLRKKSLASEHAHAHASPAPSNATSRSAYADVSDYDPLSPVSHLDALSPPPTRLPAHAMLRRHFQHVERSPSLELSMDVKTTRSRKRNSNDPLPVVTTALSHQASGSSIVAMAVNMASSAQTPVPHDSARRPARNPERERARQGLSRKAASGPIIQLPKRNASMCNLRAMAHSAASSSSSSPPPPIPVRSSSASASAVDPAARLPLIMLSSPAPITAASSMPIPQISVSSSSPFVGEQAVFEPQVTEVGSTGACGTGTSSGSSSTEVEDDAEPRNHSRLSSAGKLFRGGKLTLRKAKSSKDGRSPTPASIPKICFPPSPPSSVVEAKCSPLRRSASALSLLMKLDLPMPSLPIKNVSTQKQRGSEKPEPVIPIAIISRENSLVLDQEEAEEAAERARASLASQERSSAEEKEQRGEGADGKEKLLEWEEGEQQQIRRPMGKIFMQDALAMGPDLAVLQRQADSAAAAAAIEASASSSSTESGNKRGWSGMPAALRSVRSFASLAQVRTPRKASFARIHPLPTPPNDVPEVKPPASAAQQQQQQQRGMSNASTGSVSTRPHPQVSYDLMLGVAGALLSMDGNRQRSHSLRPRHALGYPGSGPGPGPQLPAQIVLGQPEEPAVESILLRRGKSDDMLRSRGRMVQLQAPDTPETSPVPSSQSRKPASPKVQQYTPPPPHPSARERTAADLGLGPAFTTPSPAAAVRDLAWAGRPELIPSTYSQFDGSSICTTSVAAVSPRVEDDHLRRAFWNDDDERGECSRFKRVPAWAGSRGAAAGMTGGGDEHLTPPSSTTYSSTPLGSVIESASSSASSGQRFERDQYAWLRMQEDTASPTLPTCDMQHHLGSAISTIPFPRASPSAAAAAAAARRGDAYCHRSSPGSPDSAVQRSPPRVTRKSVTDAALAYLAALHRSGSALDFEPASGIAEEEDGGCGSGSGSGGGSGGHGHSDDQSSDSDPCLTPSPTSALRTVPLPGMQSPAGLGARGAGGGVGGASKMLGCGAGRGGQMDEGIVPLARNLQALEAWLQWTE
ncbi:hypothetical protein OC834_001735 [Tilletia horrida]|nr:hypothetical protein OC834_001735 [Tilletia horrida]